MNTSKKRGAILALIGLVASGLAIGGSAAQADTAPARQSPMHDADAQCQSAGSWYITVDSVPNGVTVVDLVFDQAEAYETGYKPSANTWEVNYSGGTLSGYVLFSNDFKAPFSGSGDCTIVVPPPPPDQCSWPAVKNNDSVCGEWDFVPVCGSISGTASFTITNKPTWVYGAWFSESTPANFADGTPNGLSFAEDYNGGSVNVFAWIGGTENDVLANRGIPTFGSPEVITIDTNCEEPEPVDLVSDGTAVLCGTELVVVIFASEGPLTFGVALIDRGNGDITSLGDPEFNENVATFTATIDPNEATAPVKYNVATEDGRHSEGFAEITIDENCETPEPTVPEAEVDCATRTVTNNGGDGFLRFVEDGNPVEFAADAVVEIPEGAEFIHVIDSDGNLVSQHPLPDENCESTETTVPPTTPGTTSPPVDPETPEQPETPEVPETPEQPEACTPVFDTNEDGIADSCGEGLPKTL